MDAGWYPDPLGHEEQRYHDGQRWTEAVWGAGKPMQKTPSIPVPPQLKPGSEKAIGCLVVVVLVLVLWGIFALVGWAKGDGGGATKAPAADELRYGAFDVCTKFVKDRLKSPGSAKFRNFFEEDGEVVVKSSDGVNYIVTSTVDSQNGFGALLRSSFICQVAHVSGTQWRLVEVSVF